MCRGGCDGRRCPSNRGERRRAYQRARYKAKTNKKTFMESTTLGGSAAGATHTHGGRDSGSFNATTFDFSTANVSTLEALSPTEREELLAVALEKVARSQEDYDKAVEAFKATGNHGMSLYKSDEASKYEEVVRDLGEASHVAATLKAWQAWEDKGLTMETLKDPDRVVSLFLESNAGEKIRHTIADHEKNRKKYEDLVAKGKAPDVEAMVERGEVVSAEDMAQYLKYMAPIHYKTEKFAKPYALVSEINSLGEKAAKELSYESIKRGDGSLRNPDGSTIESTTAVVDKKDFLDNSWRQDYTLSIPQNAEVQKRMLENMEKTFVVSPDNSWTKTNASALINARRHKEYLNALKSLSRDTFDKEKMDIAVYGAKSKPKEPELQRCASMLPDSMKKYAKKWHLPLNVTVSTALGSRAHFRAKDRVEVKKRSDRPISFGVDGSPTSPGHVVFNLATSLHDKKISEKEYSERMDYYYPRADNIAQAKKARQDLKNHNEGKSEYRIPSMSNKSKPAQIQESTFTDALGVERIGFYQKNGSLTTSYRDVSTLFLDGGESTTMHELSHYHEADPQVSVACKAFLYRRTKGLEDTQYYKDERCIPDGFVNRYIGKDYAGQENTEVFSMGMERVVYANNEENKRTSLVENKKIGFDYNTETFQEKISEREYKDDEHRNLIIGILVGRK